MSEKINLLPVKENKINITLEQKSNQILLDFFLDSETNIYILDNDYKIINTIKSVKNTLLGKAVMLNQTKGINGEVEKFSYIKIENKNNTKILPIDSDILQAWSFASANESNKDPVLKQQITNEGNFSYVKHNGNIEKIEEIKKIKE